MSIYVPKDWTLDDPITELDLDHIEQGISAISRSLATSVDFQAEGSSIVVHVPAGIDSFTQPATPIVLFTVTPPADARLVLTGFITLKFSPATGTPDLSWAIKQNTGATLLVGSIGNRSRESANQPVCMPVGGAIELVKDQPITMHLAVSSSIAGDITVWGYGRTHITGVLIPV